MSDSFSSSLRIFTRKYLFVMFSLSLFYCRAFSLLIPMIYVIWVNPGLGQSHNINSIYLIITNPSLVLYTWPAPAVRSTSHVRGVLRLRPSPLWNNDPLNQAPSSGDKKACMILTIIRKFQGVCTK